MPSNSVTVNTTHRLGHASLGSFVLDPRPNMYKYCTCLANAFLDPNISIVVRGCEYVKEREWVKDREDTSSATLPLNELHSVHVISKSPTEPRKVLLKYKRTSEKRWRYMRRVEANKYVMIL